MYVNSKDFFLFSLCFLCSLTEDEQNKLLETISTEWYIIHKPLTDLIQQTYKEHDKQGNKETEPEKSDKKDDNTIPVLVRQYRVKTFKSALSFINKVGEVAERLQHHPNLHIISYNNVCIEIYTHAIKGLSENDFQLAKEIDGVEVELSKMVRESCLSLISVVC